MNICIYASELAIITGHNKYQDVSEIILKLWKKNFPEDYANTLKKVSKELNTELKEETPDEYIDKMCQKHNITQVPVHLSTCLNATSTKELKTTQKKILDKFEKLPETEKKLVKECITKKTNTNFGIKYENTALVKYMEMTGDKVKTVNKFFKKDLFKTKNNILWSIGGKIDGINKSQVLIEVKNRVKRLFYELRDYEKVQLYAYMTILNLTEAKLVENLKSNTSCDINVIDVVYDQQYWETEIETKLTRFIKYFEKLMASESKKKELITILFTSDT